MKRDIKTTIGDRAIGGERAIGVTAGARKLHAELKAQGGLSLEVFVQMIPEGKMPYVRELVRLGVVAIGDRQGHPVVVWGPKPYVIE